MPKLKPITALVFAVGFAVIGTYFLAFGHASPTTRSKLIKIGWDIPSPSQVKTNQAWIDSLPFDGIAVSLPALDSGTMSSTPHSLAEYQNALAPMPTMSHATHNFLRVTFQEPTYDWYNDANWKTTADNFANLAKAASASGKFDGIMIDPEYYGSGPNPMDFGTGTRSWTYSDTGGATPGHTAADAIAKVQLRGQQIMSSVHLNWGTAQVMILHGPYVSEPKSAAAMTPFYNDGSYANELMGPFGIGIAEGVAGTSNVFQDGGEIYRARTPQDFQKIYNWQKTGLADSGTQIIPPAFAGTYKNIVRASVGVYDRDMLASGWPTLSAATWQNLLTYGMQQTDDYTWAYTESYDWLRTGWPKTPVPQQYIDATKAAVQAATPNGMDVVPPTASITSPVSGTTVTGIAQIMVAAQDNTGVKAVSLYVNGALAANATSAPYNFTIDTTKYVNGPLSLQAKASDGTNNIGSSASITLTVANNTTPPPSASDTSAPVVKISSPVSGSRLGSGVAIRASATDNVRVVRMSLFVDGSSRSTASTTTNTLSYNWSTWNNWRTRQGSHTFVVKAYDAAGNVGLASVTVYK